MRRFFHLVRILLISALSQQHPVVVDFAAACFFKHHQQVFDVNALLRFRVDIEDDFAFMHHDGAVAVLQRVFHVMRHHHGRQMVFRNDFLRQRQHVFRRFMSG